MDAETRSRALRAARKVAFGAAFVGALPGCGGKVEVDSPPLAPSTNGAGASTVYPVPGGETAVVDAAVAETAVVDAGVVGMATVDGLRCLAEVQLGTGNPPGTSTPISDAQFACCTEYDNQRVASPADAGQAGAISSDPSFLNCCRAIIARMDTGAPLGENPNPAREACCFSGIVAPTSELWGHSFCAPWGPPVPPAMALELSA
jgi:hypothetical protein